MLIEGWKVNELELKNYEQTSDCLNYVVANKNAACFVYNIWELRMCYYVGHLAVLINNTESEILLNPNGFFCADAYNKAGIQFDSSGTIIFIKKHAHKGGKLVVPFCILDIYAKMYSFFYIVKEINNCEFELKKQHEDNLQSLDGTMIKLSELEWFDFSEIDNFEIYLNRRKR